uniref:Uncharacterized protein n=1 Tax=Human herpesvirus 1 TaxID=10298 RepID=A0A2Z4H831_HHV1|nr:hypothetical protein [Human alphaherpesvirus 1]
MLFMVPKTPMAPRAALANFGWRARRRMSVVCTQAWRVSKVHRLQGTSVWLESATYRNTSISWRPTITPPSQRSR